MTYIFRFFIKLILSLILLNRSFSIFTYNLYLQGGGYWVLPIVSFILLISTIYDGFYLKKHKLWYKKIRDKDERSYIYTLKAGYICFNLMILGITFIFVFYSLYNLYLINPLNLLGIVLTICLALFFILKIYFIYNK